MPDADILIMKITFLMCAIAHGDTTKLVIAIMTFLEPMALIQQTITVAIMNTRKETCVALVVLVYTKTILSISQHANLVVARAAPDLHAAELFQTIHA